VVFADSAELLTCLALDWMRGDAGGRWWWQALFPGRSLAEAVGQAWADRPQHVPAALVRLHEADQSGLFLRALPAATIAAICTNVARVFALEELRDVVARATDVQRARESTSKPCPETAVHDVKSVTDLVSDDATAGTLPWSDWVQDQPGLSCESQTLVVLAVMLVRAPTVVRSLRFRGRVRDFAGQTGASPEGHAPSVQRFGAKHAIATATEPAGDAGEIPVARSFTDSNPPDAGKIRQPWPHQLESDEVPPARNARIAHQSTGAPHEAETSTAELHSAPEPPSECVCSTAWGGIFYLLNVALALGLYGDFTQPRQPSLAMPVWDFLALLGRRMIGLQFTEDGAWNLFAMLSVRAAHQPPGAWFEPTDEWPGSSEGAPGEWAETEPTVAATPLERWVSRLAQVIERRLARLRNEPDRGALVELVFHQAAEVRVTSERVTVCFSLATHPIALRIAGLDRDPGWMPAAGRAIYFQYD